MPKISLSQTTQHPAQDAFKRVSNMLESDKDLKRLDSQYACTFDAQTLTGTAKGSQFKANLNVKSSGGGSQVEITVEIPLALVVVKGMIEKTLKKKLDEALG